MRVHLVSADDAREPGDVYRGQPAEVREHDHHRVPHGTAEQQFRVYPIYQETGGRASAVIEAGEGG
jgi:hypothetical protein